VVKLSFDNLSLRYEPFPIGLSTPVMDADDYEQMVAAFPAQDLFVSLPKVGYKYVLSEKFNERQYHDFIRSRPLWRNFHRWIKSDDFIRTVMEALRIRHVDLGYGEPMPMRTQLLRLLRGKPAYGRRKIGTDRLRSRFEFSMLPSGGGHVLPHTDVPSKIITLVVSIVRPGEWDPAYGGGTDVNRPKDPKLTFNLLNRRAEFEEMEVLHTFDFQPNQAILFIKTFNSWHSVRPMTGNGSKLMRRTLTINIETVR
jgi:hypothetical protein